MYRYIIMEDFSFIDEDFDIDDSEFAIGRPRPSDSIRTLNESEIKSIVTGTGESDENRSIVALCEGRGPISEIGLAVFDINTSNCHLLQVL
jgi:hypothetical protein